MRVDDDLKRKIGAAVTAAEKGTAGEIVVVIAPSSSSWQGPRALFASAIAVLAMFVVVAADASTRAAWLPIVGAAAFVAAFLFASMPLVTRLLLEDHDVDHAVLRAARSVFLERGVHRTRDRSGVLVFVSLLERRVQILGDEGVHRAVGDDGWKQYAERIVDAARLEHVDDFAAVISDIGAVLSRAFPKRFDDVNELSDEVVVQRV